MSKPLSYFDKNYRPFKTIGAVKVFYVFDKLTLNQKKCTHHSHDPNFLANELDWGSLYPMSTTLSMTHMTPHGKIPITDHTYDYIKFVVSGTMALYMMGLDHLEIYVAILKEFVPRCYNIWDLVENTIKSISRVKKPNYINIMKQLEIEKEKNIAGRKAKPEDFGILPKSKPTFKNRSKK